MTLCIEFMVIHPVKAFIQHLFLYVNGTKTDENSVYVTVFSLYL